MKRFIFLAAVFTAGLSQGADIDHLVPTDTHFHKYKALLESKLGVAPFDCGKLMITPAFSGESCLSVHCESLNGGERTCYATYIVASDNVWQRTDGVQEPAKARRIKTKRIDVQLSASTAELITQVWLRMLRDVHVHDNRNDKWRAIPVDGTGFDFSISRPRLSGELDLFVPERGPKLKGLMSISESLENYCKAEPTSRRTLADQIELEARRLLNRKQDQRF